MAGRDDIPPIHFAAAKGGRLAYQDFGSGEHTIVAIPPTAQNIEIAWNWPDIRAMLERFGSFARYVVFDKRGTGASDYSGPVNDLDARVDDLRAVMDSAGVDHAHLFAQSEGGTMAILFAATYPERVDSLMLFGCYASMLPIHATDTDRAALAERHEEFARLWGTPESPVAERFAPSLAADPEFRHWHRRYERTASSTASMRDLLHFSRGADVRELLPEIDVPTLVIHRSGDQVVPLDVGRELVEGIPGARLVEQDGNDHFAYAGDVDGWMDEVERFVTGEVTPRPANPARPPVRIVTLGRFAVEVDGVEVPTSAWGSRRARILCKRLAAARGWPVTRDELMELLWPDESDRARLGARLSVQLSAVRRILRGGVVADRETVRIDLDEVESDLADLLEAADDALIVDLYAGEFLPEDRYDDWSGAARDEARAIFVAAARREAGRASAEGRPADAAALARRLIEVDRYDETAHTLLVAALQADGRSGEARRAHDAWAAALAELDLPPPPPL